MQRSDEQVGLDIFLVEDNPVDVALFKQILRKSSLVFSLTVAKDGVEAVQRLNNRDGSPYRPDVVFLDLHLPGKNGIEILSEMKNDSQLAAIPVAVLTGSDHAQDYATCRQLGVDAYFNKTVELHDFFALASDIETFLLSLPGVAPRELVSAYSAVSAA